MKSVASDSDLKFLKSKKMRIKNVKNNINSENIVQKYNSYN